MDDDAAETRVARATESASWSSSSALPIAPSVTGRQDNAFIRAVLGADRVAAMQNSGFFILFESLGRDVVCR